MSAYIFPDRLAAVRGVLVESCKLLDEAGLEFAVAGGWVPYLNVTHPILRHPGTKDVDLLLLGAPESAERAVQGLLEAGYIPSAKHPFQLLKKLPLASKEPGSPVPMVFNIDLMHPAENDDVEGFHDLFRLSLRDTDGPLGPLSVKSVPFKASGIVDGGQHSSWLPVTAVLPNGETATHSIPLLNNAMLVLSKCESCTNAKRSRDAFDIYFTLTEPGATDTIKELASLAASNEEAKEEISILKAALRKPKSIADFNKNVAKHAFDKSNVHVGPKIEEAAKTVLDLLP